MSSKYIIVAGGVISGTGKGVTAASIGLLLRLRGFNVEIIKLDPYLNINAGILAPSQHGECFLCDDGTECDLDLGHYERIADIQVSKDNIVTQGIINKEINEEQEKGKYLGQTIQVIPHVTNKIIERLEHLGKKADVVIAEIGGTVGDIESSAFYKAVTQFKVKHGADCMIVMVAPILWVPTIKEWKTKPLQRSVIDLQSYGVVPDLLFCRVEREVPEKILQKVSDLTYVPRSLVFDAPDVKSVYQVPIEFYNRQVDDIISDKLRLKRTGCRIKKYRELVEAYMSGEMLLVNIGIFGKYDNCDEAYISLKEALYHAGIANGVKVEIRWVKAQEVETSKHLAKFFEGLHGVIIPGGFDSRGIEGKIRAIKYVRENKIPFLGICLGLQCAVIEYARNVCNLEDANSTEFNKTTKHPVVHHIEGQENLVKLCGTMRLGGYDCELSKGSQAHELYEGKMARERHRHRYEVNPEYQETLEAKGFKTTGVNPQTGLIEIMEMGQDAHPYFIGTQSHPEFRSRLLQPSPLFKGLIAAAKKNCQSC